MRRRIKVKNVILLILAGALLIGVLAGGFFWIRDVMSKKADKNEETVSERFKIDLIDYTVYRSDDFDFEFVLASLRFSDDEPINYTLSNLYTDEGLKLGSVDSYVEELESKYYYLGVKGVSFEVVSEENSATYTIFIPIKDKNKTELTLYDALSKGELKFDLNANLGDISELKYSTGSTIQTGDYVLNIADAYIETNFFIDNEPYQYPSTIQIYAFVIDIEKVKEGSLMEDAVFIADGSNEEIHALASNITAMRQNNIIDRSLSDGMSGALFFEVYNPNDNHISYNGTLKIKFSESAEWLVLETELN